MPGFSYNISESFGSSLEQIRVDRSEEVSKCIYALIEKRENVLLYGIFGIGKTFLVRLVFENNSEQQIRPSSPSKHDWSSVFRYF
jgi:DNA replication protein DnaC